MRIEVEKVGQLAVAATAQLEGLQPGIEAALLLIEQTVEQQNGGFDFLGGNLQHGRILHRGQEFHCPAG
jgi:hypothetical protein